MRMDPPGEANGFLRPSAVYYDPHFDELLVADPGRNRVVIFDQHGTYRYEFSGSERFSSPRALAVDSQGYIYVLGTTRAGRRMFRFDFDGLYLDEIPLPVEVDGTRVDIRSFDLDGFDQLVALDEAGARICILRTDGSVVRSFGITPQLDEIDEGDMVLGTLAVHGDRVFVPISNLGTVLEFDTRGKVINRFGIPGNNLGELNFPVAVAVAAEGQILVLNKHRFNVVCFSPEGKFQGEFGGKGMRSGWFYHPTMLAADSADRVYIGQIFDNKIDMCRLPEFARGRGGERSTSSNVDLQGGALSDESSDEVTNTGGALAADQTEISTNSTPKPNNQFSLR